MAAMAEKPSVFRIYDASSIGTNPSLANESGKLVSLGFVSLNLDWQNLKNDGDEVAFKLAHFFSRTMQDRADADAGAFVFEQRGEKALPFFRGGGERFG